MKQWMKYIAVILMFALIGGNSLLDSKVEANARGAHTLSGNSISMLTSGADTEAAAEYGAENETGEWSVTIQYDLKGGTDVSDAFTQAQYTAAAITGGYEDYICVSISEEIPSLTGYTFGGWYCEASGMEDIYQPGAEFKFIRESHSGADITFTAIWKAVTVTYELNYEGAENNSVTITNESLDENGNFMVEIAADVPVCEGYVFQGWLCDIDNEIYSAGSTVEGLSWDDYVGATITFTAQWKELSKVTVEYVGYDGNSRTESIQQTADLESIFSIEISSEEPERDYYRFDGWISSTDNSLYVSGSVIENLSWESYNGKTITLTEQWNALPSVTIEYVRQDGKNVTESIQQKKESETEFSVVLRSDDSEYEGYVFAGWLCDADNAVYTAEGDVATFTWEKYENQTITFTAQWVWDNYMILEAGEYSLVAGEPYYLGEGTWTVNNDGYSYAGGSMFYVSQDGNYTISAE